jgi:hypothetical protein
VREQFAGYSDLQVGKSGADVGLQIGSATLGDQWVVKGDLEGLERALRSDPAESADGGFTESSVLGPARGAGELIELIFIEQPSVIFRHLPKEGRAGGLQTVPKLRIARVDGLDHAAE